jgi:hypothetical protein
VGSGFAGVWDHAPELANAGHADVMVIQKIPTARIQTFLARAVPCFNMEAAAAEGR